MVAVGHTILIMIYHMLQQQKSYEELPHFTMARQYAGLGHPELLPSLLECQEICMQRVLDEVKELVRKHDYRFEDESQGEEMTSWRRAAELCAGNPNVSACASR